MWCAILRAGAPTLDVGGAAWLRTCEGGLRRNAPETTLVEEARSNHIRSSVWIGSTVDARAARLSACADDYLPGAPMPSPSPVAFV